MTPARIITALVFTMVLTASAWHQAKPQGLETLNLPRSVVINVKVEVSSLIPAIGSIGVSCKLINGGGWTDAVGHTIRPLVNGGFVGVVPVQLESTSDTRAPCQTTGRIGACEKSPTPIEMSPVTKYECSLTTINTDGITQYWEGGMKQSDFDIFMRAKPGTPYVSVIRGPLPPPNK